MKHHQFVRKALCLMLDMLLVLVWQSLKEDTSLGGCYLKFKSDVEFLTGLEWEDE
jgi:hypothetical protein